MYLCIAKRERERERERLSSRTGLISTPPGSLAASTRLETWRL